MRILFVYILYLIPLTANAEEIPQDFKYNGAPIDPYCFVEGKNIDLKTCTNSKQAIPVEWVNKQGTDEAHYKPIRPDEWRPNEEGMIGYEYQYAEDPEYTPYPYIYYKPLGSKLENGKTYWAVETNSSGGGTGRDSRIFWLTREGDMLKIKRSIAGGDRCNNGLTSTDFKDGKLSYSFSLTPIDIIEYGNNNPFKLKAYDDLEASAGSCFGEAHFTDDNLNAVTFQLEGEAKPDETNSEWTKKYKYQNCFNILYNAYVRKGMTEFNPKQLKHFADEFNRICVGNQLASAK